MEKTIYTPIDKDIFDAQYPEVAAEIKQNLGINFVPAIFRTMVNADISMAVNAWIALKGVLCTGNVPRILKEMILIAVAHSRNCRYCETAHIAIAIRLGVPIETLDNILNDLDLIRPASARACIQLSIDLTRNNHLIDAAYLENLAAAGVQNSDLGELFAMISMSGFMVSLADALLVEEDEDFKNIIKAVNQ